MTATPKHRLRATVTYTVEYDPGLSYDELRDLAAQRGGDLDQYGYGVPVDHAVKVEVVR